MKKFYVHIICSNRNGTLYIGVTNNLARHMHEHKNKLIPRFIEITNPKWVCIQGHLIKINATLKIKNQVKSPIVPKPFVVRSEALAKRLEP